MSDWSLWFLLFAFVLGFGFILVANDREIINHKIIIKTNHVAINNSYSWLFDSYTNVTAHHSNSREYEYLLGFMRGYNKNEKKVLWDYYKSLPIRKTFYTKKGFDYTVSNIQKMTVFYSNYFKKQKENRR